MVMIADKRYLFQNKLQNKERFMSSKKLFYVVIVSLLSCLFVYAQGNAKISGVVKDSNDAAVSGATVTALNIGSSQRITVTTDASGKYNFTNLRGGTYRITATANGFGESAENVSIDDGSSATQDFSISPGAIKDVVTVTAGKGSDRLAVEIPQTVTVTSADQIEQRVPRSTFEAMERAPNLGSIETSPARERPRLRGLSSTRLLVVIDGEKLNNARSDPGASGAPLAIVDPSQLEAVEVVAGSGSSLYGSDSIGGTINLITKRPVLSPDGLRFGVRLDASRNSNGRVNRGNTTFNISGSNVAFRAGVGLYRNSNYTAGNKAVTAAEVLSIGRFFQQFPTATVPTAACGGQVCRQSAASYPIFSLAANSEILNGQGHGNRKQFDLWFFPTEKHNIRARYLGSDEGNNGNAFSGPPYETQERYANYRKFDKFGVRYEVLDLLKFVPRMSANYFHQNISSPQDQYTFNNLPSTAGGSFVANTNANLTTFTGTNSIFSAGSFTDNRNTIATTGLDVQATLLPTRGFFVTVGGGKNEDNSQDYFYTSPFIGFGTARQLSGTLTNTIIGASTPVSIYADKNFYIQAEFDRVKWFRISAGTRYDNWKTAGLPGNGFPLSTEFAALNAAIPGLTAAPGALTSLVSALPRLAALTAGTGSVGSDRSSTTYNFGIVGRFPMGINPYFRWANSYREPGITERYLIRNFTPGVPGLASLVVGNPNLLPEKGRNYDVGIKIAQKYFNFSLGYFHNEITDLLAFSPAQTYCVAPLPGLPGGFAGGCGGVVGATLGVQINARINTASATIKGWESTGEASIPLGSMGSFNPFFTLGTLKGTNNSPTALPLFQVATVYSQTTNPIKLSGSATDFPLGNITPLRVIAGMQYLDKSGRFFAEYNIRHQDRVTRVDPAQFVGTALINYGSFASLDTFNKSAVKMGYNWKSENYKFTINGGIDNLTDRFFFEHFQNAPAPGRSFVFGFTTEIFNLFRK
jgi:outer membrane receptor protein involved in Fe transport